MLGACGVIGGLGSRVKSWLSSSIHAKPSIGLFLTIRYTILLKVVTASRKRNSPREIYEDGQIAGIFDCIIVEGFSW